MKMVHFRTNVNLGRNTAGGLWYVYLLSRQSQNHSMDDVSRDLQQSSSPTPQLKAEPTRASCSEPHSVSRDRDCTTFLCNLFQCWTTWPVKIW